LWKKQKVKIKKMKMKIRNNQVVFILILGFTLKIGKLINYL
jgi:hypothetical protein